MKNLHDKILGCLIGASVGDSMGAATEVRTLRQIKEYFGDYVTTFKDPPKDTFGRCNKAGMCTDDFIQAMYIMEAMLKNNCKISVEVMKEAFQRWREYPFYLNFTGPTTRAAMNAIFGDTRGTLQGNLEGTKQQDTQIINKGNAEATNGSAMKIWPAAIICPGNIQLAIQNAKDISSFTHNNTLAISGACAVAAAISEALSEHPSINSIIAAGIYGADCGEAIAFREGAMEVAGPSVGRRIELACSIGKRHTSWKTCIVEINDIIGAGLHVSEAVPAAFGIIKCCEGSNDSIFGGVNIGYDTDTVATMIGAIVGAYNGATSFPKDYMKTIDKMNKISLSELAKQILSSIK